MDMGEWYQWTWETTESSISGHRSGENQWTLEIGEYL